jgi:hypothetical protein
MRVGNIILVVVLLAILAVVIGFAYAGLITGSAPMPTEGYIALVGGVTVSILVGVGLMALVFYSNRHGYDEPPHRRDKP